MHYGWPRRARRGPRRPRNVLRLCAEVKSAGLLLPSRKRKERAVPSSLRCFSLALSASVSPEPRQFILRVRVHTPSPLGRHAIDIKFYCVVIAAANRAYARNENRFFARVRSLSPTSLGTSILSNVYYCIYLRYLAYDRSPRPGQSYRICGSVRYLLSSSPALVVHASFAADLLIAHCARRLFLSFARRGGINYRRTSAVYRRAGDDSAVEISLEKRRNQWRKSVPVRRGSAGDERSGRSTNGIASSISSLSHLVSRGSSADYKSRGIPGLTHV